MEKTSFSLSLENIKSIHFENYDKDFTFIVNSQRYETSRFLADFLSPTINNYHSIDETINEFTLNISNSDKVKEENNEDYFLNFLSLTTFKEQEIDYEHKKRYLEYFLQLGNTTEFNNLQKEIFDNITPENIVDCLQMFTSHHNVLPNENLYNKVIDNAATNFESISKGVLKKLDIEILESIFNSDSLKLNDEDSLLEFILCLYSNDNKYSVLFEYVIFENVKESSLEKFISEFNIEFINNKIWVRICQRLLPSNKAKKRIIERYKKRIISIEHKNGDELNGLLHYLVDQTGGNIHDNGTVCITTNSVNGDKVLPKNLVDYKNNESNNYTSKPNLADAYVCFDFKNRKIQLSSYSLKSYNYKPNDYNLKNWVIEVSNDGDEWIKIDEHNNDQTLNGPRIIATFDIKQKTDFYQFVRLRQTGKNWHDDYYIVLYCIEFYGNLEDSS